MAYAPKRHVAGATMPPSARAKPLKPESLERASKSDLLMRRARDRESGVHETQRAADWWADGLSACESDEVCADLSRDPRRER